MRKKNLLSNVGLLLISTCLTFLVLEWGFPKILHKIPLVMYPGLDLGIRILGQSSKQGPFPKNYIALMGDSYAQGKGDWLSQTIRDHRYRLTTPDYHSAHLLYRKTGHDVITFGAGGAGSLNGMISEPIHQFRHINSLKRFELEMPAYILVYFYEGNDFYDNAWDFIVRFRDLGWDRNRFFEPEYFRQFIEQEILKDNPKYQTDSPIHNLLFTRFLFKGLENAGKEVRRWSRRMEKWLRPQPVENADSIRRHLRRVSTVPNRHRNSEPFNLIRAGDREIALPAPSQAPPVDLTQEELKRAVFIFEQSLLYMTDFFKGASVKIVYIPSPLSTYPLVSDRISHDPYYKRDMIAEARRVPETSAKVCRLIEAVAAKHKTAFLDTRPAMRKAGQRQALHGPNDWQHLNERGHRTLTETISKAFFSAESSLENFGCRD